MASGRLVVANRPWSAPLLAAWHQHKQAWGPGQRPSLGRLDCLHLPSRPGPIKGFCPTGLGVPRARSAWEKGGPRLAQTLYPETPPFLAISVHSPPPCTGPWPALTSLTCKIQIPVCSCFRDKAQRRGVTCPRSHSWQAVESGFKPGCEIPEPKPAPTTVPGPTGCDIGCPSLPPSACNHVVRTCSVWEAAGWVPRPLPLRSSSSGEENRELVIIL